MRERGLSARQPSREARHSPDFSVAFTASLPCGLPNAVK
jgi:hypothetical protein